jgi:hypothetical protein
MANEGSRQFPDKLGWRGCLLALALILAGCASQLNYQSALTIVPYELESGGRIVVEAVVNERGPFRFALDTASTASVAFAGLREQLGLEPLADRDTIVRGAIASGLYPTVMVERLQVGKVFHADVLLVALPGTTAATRTIDGVLGADFLRQYAVGFSVRDNSIRLYAPESISERSYRGWATISLEPVLIGTSEQPLYFFDIEVAGWTLPALFDLGAGLNMINRTTAEALQLRSTRASEATRLSDALESESFLARFGSQAVKTGSILWRDELFLIADLEVFTTLDYTDRPLAILGSGLFTQRDFIIDFAQNRVLVQVSMPETSAAAEAP